MATLTPAKKEQCSWLITGLNLNLSAVCSQIAVITANYMPIGNTLQSRWIGILVSSLFLAQMNKSFKLNKLETAMCNYEIAEIKLDPVENNFGIMITKASDRLLTL